MPMRKENQGSVSILLLLVLGLAVLAVPALPPVQGSSKLVSVIVSAQTAESVNGTYIFSAYNSSGFLVASVQTVYPEAAFVLPSASYLFTASVMEQVQKCYQVGFGPTAPLSLPPCYHSGVSGEYGYTMMTVSGPTSIGIHTIQFSKIPTASIVVSASYPNRTAAEGASVSASVVGGWYWWGGSGLSMYNQTKSGLAYLRVPAVPVVVTAWSWVQVTIPRSQTTLQVVVGGEKVNVTVYWQPTYVGFAGSALIVPPASSASIIMHVRQPDYWVMQYGVSGVMAQAQSGSGTLASGPGGIPSSVYGQLVSPGQLNQPYLPGMIPPPPQPGQSDTHQQAIETPVLEAATLTALAVATLSFFFALRKR